MSPFRRAVAATATSLLLVVGAAGCGDDDEPGPREGVSIADLTGDASGDFDIDEAKIGSRQSLRVTIERVLSDQSFTTTVEDTAGNNLLVVGPGDDLQPGQVVQVAGILRRFDFGELEPRYRLGPKQEYAGLNTVLVANTVDNNIPQDGQ
jgi:hypothetical protein